MSSQRLPEIFPDVQLTVVLSAFKQDQVLKIVENCHDLTVKHKADSSVEVSGSFEAINKLYSDISMFSTTASQRASRHASASQDDGGSLYQSALEPVEVDGRIMEYIDAKYSRELQDIQSRKVAMKRSPKGSKETVYFQPQQSEKGTSAECHCVRERFINLYQKIMTNLQMKDYSLDRGLAHYSSFQEELPKLLMTQRKGTVSVTGSYTDIMRFDRLQKGVTNAPHSTGRNMAYTDTQARPARPALWSPGTGPASSSLVHSRQVATEETCPICLETIEETKKTTLSRCKHSFCEDCLKSAFAVKPTCPVCGVIYGVLKGTQPDNGTMDVTTTTSSLPGYERYGSITIYYHIPSGIQTDEHPQPGKRYEGVSRTAYLPDCPEGRKVLKLLQQAFKQKLIFTIGRSSTTGRSNVVTWNDIHHKTSMQGGATYYGYPDPDYLSRVQEELKAKGIF